MMKIKLKINRIIRLILCVLLVVLFVQFFMRTPGEEHVNEAKSESKREIKKNQHQPLTKSVLVDGVFKPDILGNYEFDDPPHPIGPGENGEPVYLDSSEQDESNRQMREFGFNMVASDKISLDRSIPDVRPEECRYWHYPEDLPSTSVILVFHNEGWSTLLRTIHSIINRSPPQLLKEVLLVDDFSDKPKLKKPLEEYIQRYSSKVRLIRNREREGLIRTRSIGAENAVGEVIIFLDAHCEVNHNWLPPLLTRIKRNRKTMAVPVVDGIDKDTFVYRPVYQEGVLHQGIFEWGLLYKETEVPERELTKRKYETEPYISPTHAGGLFAMDRDYFLELGGYDPGLQIWGGENFELSFKIWQCGGQIEWVPCSTVGHIYRGFMPYNFGKLETKGPIVTLNYKRVAEVWMDEYKEHFYAREPIVRNLDAGDISAQIALRNKLQCQSFKWFLENVAYEVLRKFPVLPKNKYWGEIRNFESGKCWDSMGAHPPAKVGLSHCHGYGGNQLFRLNMEGQLGLGERCVEADQMGIKLIVCPMGKVDGPWRLNEDSKSMYHTRLGLCAEPNPDNDMLYLQSCDSNKQTQKWYFKEINPY